MNEKQTARFWSRVDRRGPSECWPWTGGIDRRSGYGYFHVGDQGRYAHRLACELTRSPIPDGLFVCHRCDNPPCVNPAHLFLGTHRDNMADMRAKGRTTKGLPHPAAAWPSSFMCSLCGERGHNHRTCAKKQRFLALKDAGHTTRKLAEILGVSTYTIWNWTRKLRPDLLVIRDGGGQ